VKPSDKPAKSDSVTARDIDEVFFIMDGRSSDLHSLNPIGARIWELVDGQRTVADIAAVIVEEYEVEAGRAEGDVVEFLETLQTKKLVDL
jgi:hypothetical protein